MMKNFGDSRVKSRLLTAVALFVCLAPDAAAASPSSRTLRSMARTYITFGQYDKAQTLAAEALARAQLQDDDAELAMCLIDLGTVYQYTNNLDGAEEMLSAGIALQRRAADKTPYMAYTLRMLSSVHRRQQRYEAAQAVLDEAVALMLHEYAADDPALAFFHTEQAKLLADQGRRQEACDLYNKAIAAIESTWGPGHLCTAEVRQEAAELYLACGGLDQAQTHIDKAIAIRRKYCGAGHSATIAAMFLKARICRAAGDLVGCQQQIDKALAAAATVRDPVQLARLHQQAEDIRNAVRLARL